ncbi:hypothetical protein BU23DRAFT_515177 [Bimuria novae-zelandiae CBS 107.79]|uniref:Cyclase n=1 Tax=Bimuria novae-zelandiae CBS 107.79 TaxID=1447943 RepID=A0A6A5V442_9PLEO|nr:hypothetical protein BU23DRAFT_515177 [Bimuria novae-zelandiae CBS 107.79]
MRLDPNGDAASFPKRTALPNVAGTPDGAAWFWGGSDELGRLNLLTPERIRKSTQDVQTGEVVSLNLPLDVPRPPIFDRQPIQHQIHSTAPNTLDDTYAMNTQSSSQWDGFRHFADPRTGYFYNGVISQEILGDEDEDIEETGKLGIDAWARHGIVGRGVLLDVFRWAKESGKEYDPFSRHEITVEDLQACAKKQGVSFRTGDILLIRTGWLQHYFSLSAGSQDDRSKQSSSQKQYAGLAASSSMKDFLHNNYFAAAASDNANFEVWPPESAQECLHASMLPLWGMPIGELWNLEALSDKCVAQRRWTFLLTSSPGNVPGGVGSPPNALAIF